MNEIEKSFYDELIRIMKHGKKITTKSCSSVLAYFEEESTLEDTIGEARVHTEYGYIDFIIKIKPQYKIGTYYADFVISFESPYVEENYVAIEIDGHEWHEKTKEQVARDKKRERYLLRKDFPVMRFSGSEVFHNLKECAIECYEIMLERTESKLAQCRRLPEIVYPYVFEKEDYEND